MYEIRKMKLYDDFQCIADQCRFTCCEGWDIAVDTDTYDRWNRSEQASYFNRNVRKNKQKPEYSVKLDSGKKCPFLRDDGLCDIVSTFGETRLPDTCRSFPRITNCFEGITEHSLSCACPEVVSMLNQDNTGSELCGEPLSDAVKPLGLRIRDAMLAIATGTKHSINTKILLSFNLLTDIRDEIDIVAGAEKEGTDNLTPEHKEIKKESTEKEQVELIILELINQYLDPEYQTAQIEFYQGIEVHPTDSWLEINELFLDITQNYHEERQYKEHLQDIYQLAETLDTEEDTSGLDQFEQKFRTYNPLMEKVYAAKLYASCVSDDLYEMTVSFQMLVTELVMARYSVLLRWLFHNNTSGESSISFETVRDYIVCYSRIIGYNQEGMREFWEDSFDDAVWELGYLMLLVSN